MTHDGFSLIECIFAISIAITSCTIAVAGLRYFTYIQNATATFLQLQQAIDLARSVAIASDYQVTMHCNNNTLILKTNNQEFKHIKLQVGKLDVITLHQSGFSNETVTIQANGMTYNNGHFNYNSIKPNSLPQFNLYFNKALRTYVLNSG